MTFAYWCVLAAALIPYFTVIPAKAEKDFDNHAPRLWEEGRTGWRARGYWAHLNAFEAFQNKRMFSGRNGLVSHGKQNVVLFLNMLAK